MAQSQDDGSNHAHLLRLAYQGDARAIATLMNRHLKRQKMVAQVGWKGSALQVLIEAIQAPNPEPLMSSIYRTVTRLQLSSLKSLKVSCRQIGTPHIAWSQERAIASAEKAAQNGAAQKSDRPVLPLLSAPTSLTDWLTQKAQAELSALIQPISTVDADQTELRFLRFSFSPSETALLPLTSIRQVMQVLPQRILPVPDMPTSVLGICNFRGEILWLVDLGLQIGFQGVAPQNRLSSQAAYATQLSEKFLGWMAIVIQAQGKSLGLIVPEVIDIESHNPKQLQPPAIDLFPPTLLPFIQGYLVRSSSPVLDASALITDSRLQVHAA